MEGNCEHVPVQWTLGGGLPGEEFMHPSFLFLHDEF